MTKFSVITIEEARKLFPNAEISNFICSVNYGDDSEPDHPFGLGNSPENAFENGLNIDDDPTNNTSYYYSIVVPGKTDIYPPTYSDFSVVFLESDDLPIDFAREHDLLMVYSGKVHSWRATYSDKKAVLRHLAEEGDLENSLIIDDEIEGSNGFPLAIVPSIKEIEKIRHYCKISEKQASTLIGEESSFWSELLAGEQTLTICQWNIFLQAIGQHLKKQYQNFESA